MRKLKNWVERKLNSIKGYIAFIVFASGVVAITAVWSGFLTVTEIQAKTVLKGQNLYIPANQEKVAENVVLSVLEGTQMQDAIPYIRKASEYYGVPAGLYIGIAFAESSFNNFPLDTYNPVGVKPNGRYGDLKGYSDWEHSVNFWFHLVKEYYWEEGMKTCKQIERKYVGYNSDSWVEACQKYYSI